MILIQNNKINDKFDIVKLSEIQDDTILDHLRSLFCKKRFEILWKRNSSNQIRKRIFIN